MPRQALRAADLSRMRVAAEQLLPDTCTIQTATLSTSDYGGEVETWADTYTRVRCRAMRLGTQIRAEMRTQGDQPSEVADWIVTLHHDQAIAMGNRIVVGSRTLEPVDINAAQTYKSTTRVLCREVSTG